MTNTSQLSNITSGSSRGHETAVREMDLKIMSISQLAIEYRNGKENAFFDEEQFLREFYAGNGSRIRKIADEMMNTASLEALPKTVSYSLDKPEAMLARMAMITLLRGYYEYDVSADAKNIAHDTLIEIFRGSIPHSVAPHVKKVLVNEKYDILRILGRYDQAEAIRLYKSESPALRKLLEAGIASGMRLAGLTDAEISQRLQAN